jgi:hypothetical protein
MASLEITSSVLTLASIFHVGFVILGFILYTRIKENVNGNTGLKRLALIIAIAGVFFPTLSLLNVSVWAIAKKNEQLDNA